LGAHRVYRGAGTVVRCPACGDLALLITSLPDGHVVILTGTWTVEVPRNPG
jgi:ribosomal protein S27E